MLTVKALRESIKELVEKLGQMQAQCQTDNREPNSEERAKARDYLARIKDLEEQLAIQVDIEETEQRTQDLEKPETRTDTDTENRNHDEEHRNHFMSLGEQLMAVAVASSPERSFTDPRLIHRAASGLNEGVGSEGGFLLQENFASKLIKEVWENGEIPKRLDKMSLSKGNSMTIPGVDETSRKDGYRQGGIRMYWEEEAGEKTSSKPKYRKIKLTLKKLIGLCYTTDELMEDAVALDSYISSSFTSEMDFKITDGVIHGTGAGQPLGIIPSGCLVTVNKETGQDAATIVAENIVNMWARLKASSRKNAVWLINQDVEPQLFTMGITVGTGGSPVYMPPGGLSASPYGTLFGRPVIPIEQCQTLGTKGDIILGDFAQYQAIDKGSMKQDYSIHVRFIYDEGVFRFVYRFDGQPKLANAITPYKGTNDISHFVTLQART